MKKEKSHFISLLFSAIVAVALFYFVSRAVFMHFWGFDLYSVKHWNHILEKWQSGWVLHTSKEILFFVALLLLIPGYFLIWFSVYSFPLKKTVLFPIEIARQRKKAELDARSLAAALGPSSFSEKQTASKEPEKTIRISSQKMQRIDLLRGKNTQKHPVTATVAKNDSSLETNERENSAQRFDLWEKLAKDIESKNIFTVRQIKIKSCLFNLIAFTQNALFLICQGPDEGSVWETDDEASPAVWKTEHGSIPSPLEAMIEARKELHSYFLREMPEYSGLSINCCMILDHGDISNTDTLLTFLEKQDLSVLKTGSCQTAALPNINALVEYISSQPISSQVLNDSVAIAILDLMEEPEN